MFKKVIVLMCALVVFLCGIGITSFESNAAEYEFTYNCAEPSTSDNHGYIVLLCHDGNRYLTRLYTFMCGVSVNGSIAPAVESFDIYLDNIVFTPYSTGLSTGAFHVVNYISSSGNMDLVDLSTDSRITAYMPTDVNIVSWQVYGAGFVNSYSTSCVVDWSVNFKGGDLINSYISDIYLILLSLQGETTFSADSLDSINNLLFQLNSAVSEIEGSVDDVEAKLDSISEHLVNIDSYLSSIESILNETLYTIRYNVALIRNYIELEMVPTINAIRQESEKSNTWLEKIYNFFAEKDEKDKEAATQQGNQSTADIDNMITDDSAGFVDSLGGLTSSMSYTGTNCSWTFPTIKLPAISGVMDEVTLLESQEIDFTYWVNRIPSGILLLIQSVCTVALIVFCFKELYGAISYALTLKGGGNSE